MKKNHIDLTKLLFVVGLTFITILTKSEGKWLMGYSSREIYIKTLNDNKYKSPLSSISFIKKRQCFVSSPDNACLNSEEK